MSDQPEKANYNASEAKIADAINDAMSYFLALPYLTIEQKEEFAGKCCELKHAVIKHAIMRQLREAKPRIYKVD